MDINKTQALRDLQKALLSINGASRRLGISTNEVVIILPRHDFSYFKNVLESGYVGLFDTELDAFNAYKVEKEMYVKELAQKYQNDIDDRAYEALMNYEVDIDD